MHPGVIGREAANVHDDGTGSGDETVDARFPGIRQASQLVDAIVSVELAPRAKSMGQVLLHIIPTDELPSQSAGHQGEQKVRTDGERAKVR